MQNWEEHEENHKRFVSACLKEKAAPAAPTVEPSPVLDDSPVEQAG